MKHTFGLAFFIVILSSCVGPFQPTPEIPTGTLYFENVIINESHDSLRFRVSNNFKTIADDCNLEDFTIDTPSYSTITMIASDSLLQFSFNFLDLVYETTQSNNSIYYYPLGYASDSITIYHSVDSQTILWPIDSTETFTAKDQWNKTGKYYTAGDTIRDTLIITSITDTSIEYHFHH